MRVAIARANDVRPRLKARERAVLDAVLVLTASYSRLADDVYVADVAALAGVHERTARDALLRLRNESVIEWEPRRGQGTRSPLRLPLTGPQDARYSQSVTGSQSPGVTGSQSLRLTGSQDARRPRSTSEKSFRDASAAVDDDRRQAWIENVGAHYAHDPDAFRDEASRALKIDAAEAEQLRLQLIEGRAA